jgi:cation diffusion facilitator CzcD-associated flavoprotein CzcO
MQLFKPAAHHLSAPSLRLAPQCITPIVVNHSLPRVCIIGAGASGLALAKTLYQAGIPFDCFETSDRVGGLWAFKNKTGKSAAYRSLHANTSRDRTSFSDFPLPRNWPNFPHHTQLAQHLDAYVEEADQHVGAL